jgi:hypothetical protein
MTGLVGSLAAARITRAAKVAGLSLLIATPLALAGCVDHDGAKKALSAYGFTDAVTSKPSFWVSGCSDRDHYATAFTATNPQGARVSGVVCAGGWGGKMSTVRIDDILSPAPVQPVANSVPLAN